MIYRIVPDGGLRAIAYRRDPRDAGEVAGRAELLSADARRYVVKRADRAPLGEEDAIAVRVGRDWGRSRMNPTTNRALCLLLESRST